LPDALATVAMPEISPPPPIGTISRSISGASVEHLDRDRALAGDDLRIVEGVDDGEALRLRHVARKGQRLVDILANRMTLAPCPRVCVTFTVGVVRRHDDRDRDAQPRAMIGQPLRMIAGGGGDHAARLRFGAQLQQFVECAALLIGGGELQILEFE
jgi:hypothetical protein